MPPRIRKHQCLSRGVAHRTFPAVSSSPGLLLHADRGRWWLNVARRDLCCGKSERSRDRRISVREFVRSEIVARSETINAEQAVFTRNSKPTMPVENASGCITLRGFRGALLFDIEPVQFVWAILKK